MYNISSRLKQYVSSRRVNKIRELYYKLLIKSISDAIKEQELSHIYTRLTEIVPDIRYQYSQFEIDTQYLEIKVRGQHSFQISLVKRAIVDLNITENKNLTIVDIGDSSGTHSQYIRGLYNGVRTVSVNLDKTAVEKIRAKGLEAIHSRAEDLSDYSVDPDIFICFQTLEHLADPIYFLHNISLNASYKAFIISVPYLRRSRVGLRHIREKVQEERYAENAHIFELSPEDWRLIFQHAGWEIFHDEIYWQYPRKSILRLLKYFWRKYDFEGFYGAILVKNHSWSSLYMDW